MTPDLETYYKELSRKTQAYDVLLIAHTACMKARQELEAEVDRFEKANVILQSKLDAASHHLLQAKWGKGNE